LNKLNIFAVVLTAFSTIAAQAIVFSQPDYDPPTPQAFPEFNSVPQSHHSYSYDDPLVEAQMIAINISGQLQAPQDLTQQILNDLVIIRATYPEQAYISYFPLYVPKKMIVGLTDEAVEEFKAGNYHGLDSLNEQYGVVEIEPRFYGNGLNFILLTFGDVYNMELLSDIYKKANPYGLDYAEPDHVIGDSSTIIAEPPKYIFSERWGDCPAGCTEGRDWNFTVADGKATLQIKKPPVKKDTKKPRFNLQVSPRILKPMNYEMVPVSVKWTVRDNIDPSPEVYLVNIVVIERGKIIADMTNSNDIVVTDTGSIYLRAARTNIKYRRTYVITYQAMDDSGNVKIRRAKVYVSKKQIK
jgi:hypothetical protein